MKKPIQGSRSYERVVKAIVSWASGMVQEIDWRYAVTDEAAKVYADSTGAQKVEFKKEIK